MNARQVVYFLTDQLVYFPSGVRIISGGGFGMTPSRFCRC